MRASSQTYNIFVYVPKIKATHHHQYYINLHFTSCHFSEGFTFVQTMAPISQQDSMKALKTVCLHFDDSEKKGLKRKLDETTIKHNNQKETITNMMACSRRLSTKNQDHKDVRAAVHHNASMLISEAMTVLRSGQETGLDIAEARFVYNKLRVVVDELAPLIPDDPQ